MTTDKVATIVITVCAATLAALTTAFAATGGFEAQPEWGAPRFEPAPSAQPAQSVEGGEDEPRSPGASPAVGSASKQAPGAPGGQTSGETENAGEAKPVPVRASKESANAVDTPDESENDEPKAGEPSKPAEPDEADDHEGPKETDELADD